MAHASSAPPKGPFPALYVVVSTRTCQLSHVGVHDELLASELVQLRTPPFVAAVDTSHGFGLHVAEASFLSRQDDVPDNAYPVRHVGLHSSESVQVQSVLPKMCFISLSSVQTRGHVVCWLLYYANCMQRMQGQVPRRPCDNGILIRNHACTRDAHRINRRTSA